MLGPYVHRLDPVLGELEGVYLWWYGLSYTLGFLQMLVWLRRRRHHLKLTQAEANALTLFVCVGVLLGGRFVEVAFDEWPFYSGHPWLIPAYWLGGMATHGLLIGAALGAAAFACAYRKPFLDLADELVVPGALLMGLGRLGNFVDGQIVGSVTDAWWGVRFPDAEGFRHPVVLYDGVKNLLLVPYLVWVRRTNRTPGATAARFVFWYALLRIGVDLFRDYPTHRLALGTGQTLNIAMTAIGAILLVRSRMRRLGRLSPRAVRLEPDGGAPREEASRAVLAAQHTALACLLLFCLTIPSNWTQDVPRRYGERHEGLRHSRLYPAIDTSPSPAAQAPRP
jgi:phosphatidylglycerol---prolipoprotein diacylglyceryl transferase